MRHRVSALVAQISGRRNGKLTAPFSSSVQAHLAELAEHFSCTNASLNGQSARSFSTSSSLLDRNRVQPSIRRPADFHTLLQSASTTNTLLLTLFRTATCRSCSNITSILEDIVQSRSNPSVGDGFGSIIFAELELDSPERDEGGGSGWTTMYDIGIEYGVRSVPTLIGFGGRRAERITDQLADEKKLRDRQFMQEWIDEIMKKGDPHSSQGPGILGKIFGGGS